MCILPLSDGRKRRLKMEDILKVISPVVEIVDLVFVVIHLLDNFKRRKLEHRLIELLDKSLTNQNK